MWVFLFLFQRNRGVIEWEVAEAEEEWHSGMGFLDDKVFVQRCSCSSREYKA